MQPPATESDRTKVSPDCLILPSPRQLHNQPLSKHSPSQFHPHSSSFGFQQICFFCALPQKYDLIDTTVAWTAPKISFSPRGEFSTTGFGSKNLPRLPLFNIKLLWTESALSKIVGKLNFETIKRTKRFLLGALANCDDGSGCFVIGCSLSPRSLTKTDKRTLPRIIQVSQTPKIYRYI